MLVKSSRGFCSRNPDDRAAAATSKSLPGLQSPHKLTRHRRLSVLVCANTSLGRRRRSPRWARPRLDEVFSETERAYQITTPWEVTSALLLLFPAAVVPGSWAAIETGENATVLTEIQSGPWNCISSKRYFLAQENTSLQSSPQSQAFGSELTNATSPVILQTRLS